MNNYTNTKIFSFAFILLSAIFFACFPKPAHAGQEALFTKLYDAYCNLASRGEVDRMASLRTSEIEKQIRADTLTKDGRAFFTSNARLQVPDSYKVLHVHVNRDRESATMYILAKYSAVPKIERPAMSIEAAIGFKLENNVWKLDEIRPMNDPSKIKRPKDFVFNPADANTAVVSNIFGRVVSIDFKKDHVLVILRVMDEDIAVFMPEKSKLEKIGVKFEELEPWNFQQFRGFPHKTDELKFFATGNQVVDELPR